MKSASYVLDSFRDTESLSSQDPLAAPFNRAFNAPMHFFEWCELPKNELRFRRFGATMKDSISTVTPDTALAGVFPIQPVFLLFNLLLIKLRTRLEVVGERFAGR
jgi:hypothetical protein